MGNKSERIISSNHDLPSSIPDKVQIPGWWFSADPQKVLADPLFPTLTINERTEILTQIDSKFAKMSSDKRHAYLWRAETDYLPKAEAPREVMSWSPADKDCSTAFDTEGLITKTIAKEGVRIEATLDRIPFLSFFKARLKVVNDSGRAIPILPQTFVLNVVKPKRYTLFYEYSDRVRFEVYSNLPVSTFDPNMVLKVAENMLSGKSMISGLLVPGMSDEGYVWFEQSREARELVLRVSIGNRAFDLPFAIR